MKTGEAGIALIKSYEKLRLKAYAATADEKARGIWTIGWGHIADVREGDTCTEAEAEAFLREDLADAEKAVNDSVTVPLNQNQFDALVSFTFNVGTGAFRSSTMLRKLNDGNYDGAAMEFARWNKQSGQVLNGLTKRRAEERDLFSTPKGE